MKKVMIWDIPIRVFHWAFAFCSAGALAIALMFDYDSAAFPFHILLGISACFFLIMRLALGIFGCRHNRFKALLFSPRKTFRYMVGTITGTAPRYIVHNPGSATAAIGMFLVVPLLLWTGLLSIGGAGEDIHEMLAYTLLALIIAHLAGLTVHTIRHGENIAHSMVTGFKQGPAEQSLRSSHPIIGIAVVLVSVVWLISLFTSYNTTKRTVTLPLIGNTIQIG